MSPSDPGRGRGQGTGLDPGRGDEEVGQGQGVGARCPEVGRGGKASLALPPGQGARRRLEGGEVTQAPPLPHTPPPHLVPPPVPLRPGPQYATREEKAEVGQELHL